MGVDTIEGSSAREVAMRYGKDQKQATRQRIVEAAGRRFKQDGIDGAGVAAVDVDAGLTNGAFYATSRPRRISSRTSSPTSCVPNAKALTPSPGSGGTRGVRPRYLSPQHRDQCADGCPSAALLDEIARRPAATRQVFHRRTDGLIDDIASRLDPTDVGVARRTRSRSSG